MSEFSIDEKKHLLSKYSFPYNHFQELEKILGYSIKICDKDETVEYVEFCSNELMLK
jgi:hypothetical protein